MRSLTKIARDRHYCHYCHGMTKSSEIWDSSAEKIMKTVGEDHPYLGMGAALGTYMMPGVGALASGYDTAASFHNML